MTKIFTDWFSKLPNESQVVLLWSFVVLGFAGMAGIYATLFFWIHKDWMRMRMDFVNWRDKRKLADLRLNPRDHH